MLNYGLLAYLVRTPRDLINWNLVTVEAGGFRPLTFLTTPIFHPSQDPFSSAVPALWIIFPPHMPFGTCKELTEFFISPTRTFLLDEDSFISPIPPLGRSSFGVNGTMLCSRTNRNDQISTAMSTLRTHFSSASASSLLEFPSSPELLGTYKSSLSNIVYGSNTLEEISDITSRFVSRQVWLFFPAGERPPIFSQFNHLPYAHTGYVVITSSIHNTCRFLSVFYETNDPSIINKAETTFQWTSIPNLGNVAMLVFGRNIPTDYSLGPCNIRPSFTGPVPSFYSVLEQFPTPTDIPFSQYALLPERLRCNLLAAFPLQSTAPTD